MGVLGTCTMRSLKGNPVRTAVTVVGIALAAALILAVVTSALSLYRYVVDIEQELSGSYNVSALGVTADEVAAAADAPGIERVAAVERQGWALVNEGSATAPYLNVEGIVGGEEGARALADLVSLRLTEGRMPVTADELLLPASAVASGLVDACVGEQITLELGRRVDAATGVDLGGTDYVATDADGRPTERLDDLGSRTFTVCGLYADNQPLFRVASGGAPVAGLPAFTACEGSGAFADGGAPAFQVWAAVADPLFSGEVAAGLFPRATIFENTYINRLTTFSADIGMYRTALLLTAVILAVVIASSVMLIRNSFAISVSERTRQFGLLASVGATRRQLRGMVLREALVLGCVAVPFGIALGYGGCALVLALCRELVGTWAAGIFDVQGSQAVLAPVFSLPVVALTVALTIATVLLSARGPARRASRLSAIDAIRSAADVKVPAGVVRSGRVCGALFGVEGAVAARSFRRAAKPRRATVASLVTGTVLVVTAVLLGSYVSAFFATAAPETERTYDLRYWFTESRIGSDAGVEEVVDELVGAEGVTEGIGVLETMALARVGAGAMDEGVLSGEFAQSVGDLFSATVQFVPDGAYRAWLESEGLDADALMDAGRPRGVAVNMLDGSVDGRYATFPVFAGEPFTFVGAQEVQPGSELDDMPASLAMGDAAQSGDAAAYNGFHRIEVEVGAFVQRGPWWLGVPSLPVILLPMSAVEQVDPSLADDPQGQYANRSWEVLVRSENVPATEADLRARLYALDLSDTRLYNVAQGALSMVSLFKTAQMFVWAFAVIVTLIAATGAFNTMYTGVSLRRREFAVLRSIGMTRRGLAKMLLCECMVYGLHVLAWSAPIVCAVSGLLWAAMGPSVASLGFIVPWAVLPTVAGAFLVVVAACAYAVRRVDVGASPVDALRTETA